MASLFELGCRAMYQSFILSDLEQWEVPSTNLPCPSPAIKRAPDISFIPHRPRSLSPNPFDRVLDNHNYFANNAFRPNLVPIEQNVASPLKTGGYKSDCDALMWGSDLSFGPNGYLPPPEAPTQADIEGNLFHLYTKFVHPVTHQATGRSNISQKVQLEQADNRNPGTFGVNEKGTERLTRKKRRRLLHIIAERNRRIHQKSMYEDLSRIVPGLDMDTHARKREVLKHAADWLEGLIEGNKELAKQLRQLTYCEGFS